MISTTLIEDDTTDRRSIDAELGSPEKIGRIKEMLLYAGGLLGAFKKIPGRAPHWYWC